MKLDSKTQMHLDQIKAIDVINERATLLVSCNPNDHNAFNLPNTNRWYRPIDIKNIFSYVAFCIEKRRREDDMSRHPALDSVFKAMDAYARQEAIEYAKFVYEDCDRLSDNTWACRITSWREEYTSDQLYNLYLTYKNKNNE